MTFEQIQHQKSTRMSVPYNPKLSSTKNQHSTSINFPYTHYPFPNHELSAQMFNTFVQCNINNKKIGKITQLKCQNMINIKKIVKLKIRNQNTLKKIPDLKQSKHNPSTYSFYYQKVEYSLDNVLESKFKQHPHWLRKYNLSRRHIKKTLANLVASLYKQGIILFLQFQQIGINKKGIIKVYVPPNLLFDQFELNSKAKILVVKYLDQVLRFIDAKYPRIQRVKNSQSQVKLSDFTIQKDIAQLQESIINGQPDNHNQNNLTQNKIQNHKNNQVLLQNGQKSFQQDEQQFFVASGSTNLDNIKTHKEIKKNFENKKLVSKAQQNLKKQKKSRILIQLEQKQKIDQLTQQIHQIRQKLRYKSQQKVQKIPIASKVFKTMATQDKTQIKEALQKAENKLNLQPNQFLNRNKQRKNTLSSINFYTGKLQNKKNENFINNIYEPNDTHLRSFYGPPDDMISVDTYQLQIGEDYQMPNIAASMGLRSSLTPKNRQKIQNLGHKFQIQQKQTQKLRVHESAGGKNYGYIVNLLKPQFQPKKSNIFEEPEKENEQESKNSTSLKKSSNPQSISKNSLETKKQIIMTMEDKVIENEFFSKKQTIKMKNLQVQNRVSFSPCQSQRPSFEKRATLPLPRFYKKSPENLNQFLKKLQQKPKKKIKSSELLHRNIVLQEKVKQAMQKTKRAIQVLNQAKQKKNMIIK